ncbi:hypothetical protein ACHAWF_004781 [Thalassiosira exigua]
MDHLIESAGDKETLIKLLDYHQIFFTKKDLVDPQHSKAVTLIEADRYLLENANGGNSMAQYLVGKMYGNPTIPFGKPLARRKNELPQIGLGSLHIDDGNLPTAIHWFKRALDLVAVPEAAHSLGRAYAGESNAHILNTESQVPVQYEVAAKYFARAAEICYQRMKYHWKIEDRYEPGNIEKNLSLSAMTQRQGNNRSFWSIQRRRMTK